MPARICGPRYIILCNFDEFWIYDFDAQMEEPVDRIALADLPKRYTPPNFLFPDDRKPQFGNDRVAVTRAAADKVANAFHALIQRGEQRTTAQRFVLQSVVAMFAEDSGLLPRGTFTALLEDCRDGQSSKSHKGLRRRPKWVCRKSCRMFHELIGLTTLGVEQR